MWTETKNISILNHKALYVIWTAICYIKVDNWAKHDFWADFNKFPIFCLEKEMTILHPKSSNLYITSALRLLALRELLFTLYLYSVWGKVTCDNWNLKNLRYNKKYLSRVLTLIKSESAYPITPVEPLKPRFWYNSEICLLFSRKQQQISTTCCWQYHIRNQRPRLPLVVINNKYSPQKKR